MATMRVLTVICACLLVAGCASGPDPEPDQPLLRETTFERYDGTPISIEEIRANRSRAQTTARVIALAERSLREPQFENRDARQVFQDLRIKLGAEAVVADDAWIAAEPRVPGARRKIFNEFGVYSSALLPFVPGPRITPRELVDYLEVVQRAHAEFTPESTLLAAWRRFAPLSEQRGTNYLSSAWTIELDYPGAPVLLLRDSLLGPFSRCGLQGTGTAFLGPEDTMDGYTAPRALLELLMPGPVCPIPGLIDDWLARCGTASDEDGQFLRAALRGLRDGHSSLEYLPAATSAIQVTYSYLVDRAEARITARLERTTGGWTLQVLEYEPAAASMTGNSGARLDLLGTLKKLGAIGR